MENVGSVIVGALIALFGTVVVQLWLTPLVDSRKRREQRWEADVRALGELLIFTEPQIRSAARSALHWQILLREPPENADPKRWAALVQEREEAGRAAWHDYDRIRSQVDWLVDRVESVAPHSRALRPFSSRALRLSVARWTLEALRYAPDGAPPTKEALEQADSSVSKATLGLMEELRKLVDGRPPRDPTWVEHRVMAWRGKLRRRAKGPAEIPPPSSPS